MPHCLSWPGAPAGHLGGGALCPRTSSLPCPKFNYDQKGQGGVEEGRPSCPLPAHPCVLLPLHTRPGWSRCLPDTSLVTHGFWSRRFPSRETPQQFFLSPKNGHRTCVHTPRHPIHQLSEIFPRGPPLCRAPCPVLVGRGDSPRRRPQSLPAPCLPPAWGPSTSRPLSLLYTGRHPAEHSKPPKALARDPLCPSERSVG